MGSLTVVPLDEAPAALLAERKRLGLDRFDEVWDGVLHMNPAPNMRHGRLARTLLLGLTPAAEAAGLEVLMEMNLIAIGEPGWNDYRVPDLMVIGPAVDAGRGVQGPPELVIEVRSPGDDSYRKLPFYEQIGAGEVVIAHRDTGAIEHWINGPGGLTRVPATGGAHQLRCLAVTLATEGDGITITARPA